MSLTLATAGVLTVFAPAAHADVQTGANATKNCPGATAPAFFTLGSVVPCSITFTNTGSADSTVDAMTEQAPFPGGPTTDITSCATASSTIHVNDTLAPNTPCTTTVNVTIPNDPTLCNTVFRDRAEIDLEYPGTGPPPLTAGAFATGTIAVVCPPHITVTKTATPLSKPTDNVHYDIKICNSGLVPVARQSVTDALVGGDISADFAASLNPNDCTEHGYDRIVQQNDPNPLVNSVTAVYTAAGRADTETATASTDLFYPSVHVDKTCGPSPIEIGMTEGCKIIVTNTSTGTTPPALNPASISDSLNGDILTPGNPAVTGSTCNAPLATGASCEIDTARVVLASDPNPLVNTVNVLYHPDGFPNNITDQASASVQIVHPAISLNESADALSKPTDNITITEKVCNTGDESVTRNSVHSDLLGDITSSFPQTLVPGQCDTETFSYTVKVGDPNPLVDHSTADYSGIVNHATAQSQSSTDLFFPSLSVSKNCGPSPIEVGQNELCTIKVTNTSTGTTPPALNAATIGDSLTGDLLDPSNAAVTSNTCNVPVAAGDSCTIGTSRTVLASDPTPLINTVNVLFHPIGFPNNITGQASAQVDIVTPGISITADATALSKPTDDVTYHVQVCNTGNESVNRVSVLATVLGDETSQFPATLAPKGQPGDCSPTVTITRTVQAGDPNPLVVTFTANYSGIVTTVTATQSVSTDLFYPSVKVTKSCAPNPLIIGQAELCTIGVTNTSTGTTPPALNPATISDTLTGNLLDPANTAVTSNTCIGTALAVNASCQINTSRVVLASDPNPLVNTVSVLYHPAGFPNNITSTASATLPIQVPVTNQCTLGYWKQTQHFGSWATPPYYPVAVAGHPATKWNDVFSPFPGEPANLTLLGALNLNGGGFNTFARHAVAELLNSAGLQKPDETTAQVILEVNTAIANYIAHPQDPNRLNKYIVSLADKYDAQQQADNCTGFLFPKS